jgi:hypothetical protein
MAADLVEIHERIEFVRSETELFNRECWRFFMSAVKVETRPWADNYEVLATLREAIPVRLKSKAGMLTNELRSCLDSLACVLAIRNNCKNVRNVQFPIYAAKKWLDEDGRDRLGDLSPADKQTILDLKPYPEGNPLLFGLHEADRTRKHQRLLVSSGQGAGASVGGVHFMPGAMILGSVIGDVPIDHLHVSGETLNAVGHTVSIAWGSGRPTSVHPVFTLGYAEPEVLVGYTVPYALGAFSDLVQEIVRKFD